MNEIYLKENGELIGYQTSRLQDLINEIVQCCEDKRLYESQRFGVPYAELKCLMLFDGERYLTVKGIAQKLDVAKSRVTKLINQSFELLSPCGRQKQAATGALHLPSNLFSETTGRTGDQAPLVSHVLGVHLF